MIHPWNHRVFERLWTAERPQGLLLTGPVGLGKGALARHLAQAILCEREGATTLWNLSFLRLVSSRESP